MESPGRPTEMQFLGYGDETTQMTHVHASTFAGKKSKSDIRTNQTIIQNQCFERADGCRGASSNYQAALGLEVTNAHYPVISVLLALMDL